MASADHDTAAAAAPVIKLPPFTNSDVCPWFHRVEAIFRLRGITSASRKADYIIGALPAETFALISTWLMDQQDVVGYDDLKAQIILKCVPTPEEQAKRILQLVKLPLGDQRASTAFQEMRALATIPQTDGRPTTLDLLRVLWLLRLPQAVRSQITDFTSLPEDELLRKADSLQGAHTLASPSTAAAASSPQPPSDDEDQHLAAAARRPTIQRRPPDGSRVPSWRQPTHPQTRPESTGRYPCYYHHRFGRDARQCRQPCSWSKNL